MNDHAPPSGAHRPREIALIHAIGKAMSVLVTHLHTRGAADLPEFADNLAGC